MIDDELKDQHSPRLPQNWEKFKSWAVDQKFLPDELAGVTSFQEAEETIRRFKQEKEADSEYYDNLFQLLLAVEQLYVNMCLIDEKMRTLSRRL